MRRVLVSGMLVAATFIFSYELSTHVDVAEPVSPRVFKVSRDESMRSSAATPQIGLTETGAGERPASSSTRGALCDVSARCGLADACIDGYCQSCTYDDQCGDGEACAVGKCLDKTAVACRKNTDCRGGEFCSLSSLSADPRGNRGVSSTCLSTAGQAAFEPPTSDVSYPADNFGISVTELQREVERLRDSSSK